jgi:hypothetical protein
MLPIPSLLTGSNVSRRNRAMHIIVPCVVIEATPPPHLPTFRTRAFASVTTVSGYLFLDYLITPFLPLRLYIAQ